MPRSFLDLITTAYRRGFTGSVGAHVLGAWAHSGHQADRSFSGIVEAVYPNGLLLRAAGGYRSFVTWIDLYAQDFLVRPPCELHTFLLRAQAELNRLPVPVLSPISAAPGD